MRHAINWFEIPVANCDRARTFYEAILQVEMHNMSLPNGLRMAIFPVDPGCIGGALCEHADFYHPGKEGPLVYLNAEPTLQPVIDRVEQAGGKVVVPITQISADHGYMAVIEDTEGNRVALRAMQ